MTRKKTKAKPPDHRPRSRASRPFVVLWTLAVAAASTAFVVQMGLRSQSLEIGYELGRAHTKLARLREVRRVLEVEVESHKTPERVELIARTLLGMSEPPPERILPAGREPEEPKEEHADLRTGVHP